MMVHWMAYCLAVGTLLSAAALAAEAALRAFRRPARWVWAAALALSVGIPAAARWGPREAPVSPIASVTTVVESPGAAVPSLAAPVDPAIDLAAFDQPLIVVWAGVSIMVAMAWIIAWGLMQRRRRTWRADEVDGVRVLVSPDTGPAVIGIVRSRIVLPEWVVREADPSVRGMMLEHEAEHVRAGDPRLLAFALVAVALVPWSPAAWWQLRRLRLAMEVDCDARVLARRGDVRAYGALLLEVGRRAGGSSLAAAAFSEPRSFLERRIRMMTQRSNPRRVRTSFTLAAFAMAAVALMRALPLPAVPLAAQLAPVQAGAAADTVKPRLTNVQQIVRALNDQYPPELRAARVSGTVTVSMRITATGAVVQPAVVESSDPRFNEAAVRAMQVARFQPARVDGRAVPFTLHFPVQFLPESTAPGTELRAGRPRSDWDQAPALTNAAEVARALDREYPPALKAAGTSAQAQVQIRVDATGAVQSVEALSESHAGAGAAAERAVRRARFRPATKDGEPVPAEFALPVNFTPAPVPAAAPSPAAQPTPAEAPQPAQAVRPAQLTPREALDRYFPGVLTGGAGEGGRFIFLLSARGEVLAYSRSDLSDPAENPWRSRAVTALLARAGVSRDQVEDAISRSSLSGPEVGPNPVEVTFLRVRADAN